MFKVVFDLVIAFWVSIYFIARNAPALSSPIKSKYMEIFCVIMCLFCKYMVQVWAAIAPTSTRILVCTTEKKNLNKNDVVDSRFGVKMGIGIF